MAAGERAGGIAALLDLIEEHTEPLAYDWRTRFHLPISAIGSSVTWSEAWMLTTELLADPSSHTAASVGGWAYPESRAEAIAKDTFDLHMAVNSGKKQKAPPYPRPFPDPNKAHVGSADVFSQDQIRAALDGTPDRPISHDTTHTEYERLDGERIWVTHAQAESYRRRRND